MPIWLARLVGLALPHTAALTAVGIGWAILLGIPLGCFSAINRGSWLDRITGVLAVSGGCTVALLGVGIGRLLFGAVFAEIVFAPGARPAGL